MKKIVFLFLILAILFTSIASAEVNSYAFLGEGFYASEEFACQMIGLEFLFKGYMAIEASSFWYFTYCPSTKTDGVFVWMVVEEDAVENMAAVMADMEEETCFVLSPGEALAYIPYADKEPEGWEVYTDIEDFTEAMLRLA